MEKSMANKNHMTKREFEFTKECAKKAITEDKNITPERLTSVMKIASKSWGLMSK